MSNTFTAVFERDGNWLIGYVEELPGAHTQGARLEEACENLKEAVELILESIPSSRLGSPPSHRDRGYPCAQDLSRFGDP